MNLPGICLKVPGQGGVTIDAGQATMNLSNALFINGDADGKFPQIVGVLSDIMLETRTGGLSVKNPGGYFAVFGGSTFMSGSVQAEGDCYIKGIGVFADEPVYPGQWTGPTLAECLSPAFDRISNYQYPYALADLKKNIFGFRTDEQYSTEKGKWFEHFWQRELEETVEWNEKAAQDGSYPYPGKANYTQNRSWWTYEEANVDLETGRSKRRDSLSGEPVGFTPNSWNAFKVHPT
jgi:hypothetical protein